MHRLLALMLFAIVSSHVPAQDLGRARSEALAGDQSYEASDYVAAVEHYRNALREGLDHADLHYNLGNAHYKNGELGKAIASYERCLLRSPRHEAARSNLSRARQATRDEAFGPLELPLFLRPLGFVYDRVALNEWALAALMLAFLAASLAISAHWRPAAGPRLRAPLVATMLLFLLCAGMAGLRTVRDHGRPRAVVTVEEAQVRSGPGSGYNVSFKVHEGLVVFVSQRRDDWAQIHLGGQLVGWVPVAEIETL